MILRIVRARVLEGQEARLTSFVREEAVAHAMAVDGLLSFQPAVRQTRAGRELSIITTWSGFEALAAAGRDMDAPLAVPGLATMITDSHAEHYELVIGEARAMPLRQAKLRLTRIPIRPNLEASYYATVRDWADRLLDETGLVAFTLGRRVVGRQDDIIAIQVWQDEAALLEAAGTDIHKPMGSSELSKFWAADPAIEHFDALTAIDPRPDAPAILVADDRRRYVHATPAAAELSGRPLARLLTMRVEDITRESERDSIPAAWERLLSDGRMEGPYTLARPDGSDVRIRFAAKANTPWPGAHASVLIPAGASDGAGPGAAAGDDAADDLDVERALVDAGFVARYSRS